MPNVGLKSLDGEQKVRWEDIDLVNGDLSPFYPADPALVAFALEQSSERGDVDSEEISASQLEKGIRQLYLESVTDYYVTITSQIASIMGTMRHSMVNIERPGFISETRLFFEEGGKRIASAKCDTFHIKSGKLADLKNIKWYSIKMMLEQGVMKAHPGYGYQLNLFRVLLKRPENRQVIKEKYPDIDTMAAFCDNENLEVKIQQLTCVPPDLNWINKKEAMKLVPDPEIIPILVPFIEDALVLDTYRHRQRHLAMAHATGTAMLCTPEERWTKDGGYPLRCAKFCNVVEACRQMSADRKERHPLDAWQEMIKNKPSKKKAA